MSGTYSVPSDWDLSPSVVPPAQRRVSCLPAEPLSEQQLADLLTAEPVVEVWIPRAQHPSFDASPNVSTPLIQDIWLEFADRLHAVRYDRPTSACPVAWYRALRPIERDAAPELVEQTIERCTRLSRVGTG